MDFTLNSTTNYIYTFFVFSAKDSAPNRDGGTGEIRQDSQGRVFTTQECFNQNVKNGIFYGKHSGLIKISGELLSCKNEAFGPQTLKNAQEQLLDKVAKNTKKAVDKVSAEDIFLQTFDIPCFGMVNSDGRKDKALDYSLPGSCGLIYLPATITQVKLENRGISNAFSQAKEDGSLKGMPGSHYSDFLTEGVFATLGIFNVRQLEFIAKKKFGMTDDEAIRRRIRELYQLYVQGIWEGFKLLSYASTMRRGQQPISLYVNQSEQLCQNYITAPADLLRNENGNLPIHETIEKTLRLLSQKLQKWFDLFESEWTLLNGRKLISME